MFYCEPESYSCLHIHTLANLHKLSLFLRWPARRARSLYKVVRRGAPRQHVPQQLLYYTRDPKVRFLRVLNKGHDPRVRSVTPGAGQGPTAKRACCLL